MKILRQFRRHIALLCFDAVDFFFADLRPHQIAGGLVAGLALGFFPPLTLQWLLLLLAALLIRLNTAATIFGALSAYLVSSFIDPLFHKVGYFALTLPGTHGLHAWVSNAPIFAFACFNNTVVMGSFLVGLAMAPLVFFGVCLGVKKGSWRVRQHIDNSPIWNRILNTRLLQAYVHYRRET